MKLRELLPVLKNYDELKVLKDGERGLMYEVDEALEMEVMSVDVFAFDDYDLDGNWSGHFIAVDVSVRR